MNSLFRTVRLSNLNLRGARDTSRNANARRRLAEAVRSSTCFEPLETRALLSATIDVNDINADAPSHNVVVTYFDADGVDASSIGADDISVAGAKPVSVSSVTTVASGTQVVATYVLGGPGGGWDASDNGGYAITVAADAVKDVTGANIDDGAAVSAFDVNIPPPPDTTAPTVNSISVGDINTAGGATHTVTVVYADESGIDASSIGTNDLTITRNGSSTTLNVTNVNVSGGGPNQRTATYTFQAPGGSWDQSDNGAYTVTVNAGAVTDDSFNKNGSPAASAGFTVNAPPPPDTTGPSASIATTNLAAAAATHTVTVTYTDNVALNASTIGVNDIDVSANGSSLTITDVQVNAAGDGRSAVVTYTVAGPGGDGFNLNDNGTYTVRLNPGSVTDAVGNAAAGSPATFTVNIAQPPPVDNTGPTAAITTVADVTTAGGTTLNVVVTYTDETAMNAASIGPADIDVSRVGPGGDLEVVNVSSQVSGDGKTIVATYTLAAPGGSFDLSDNGLYAITVNGPQVRDAANNPAQGATSSFTIGIQSPLPVDVVGPVAVISTGDVTTPGGTSHTITVVYTDDTAINVDSIGVADLNVAAPGGGTLVVTGFSNVVSEDGKTVTTTYTVAAPGGTFDSADNGIYTVSLNASAVRDTSGNGAIGAPAAFTVNLVGAPPADQGPTAVITAPDITSPGGSTQTVTVVYSDDGRVKANTIDVGDIVVTRGGSPLVVTGVTTSASNGGTTITATYTLAAPGGTWDGADNGAYTITLAAGAVTDTQGNGNAVAGGSFNVTASVPDGSDPAASIAAGNVTTEGVTNQIITVTYTDDVGIDPTTIGTDDISVTGPIGSLVATTTFINLSSDGKSAVVTYTFSSPEGGFTFEHNGTYTVTLNAGAVRDTSGKAVGATGTTFEVAVAEPTPIDPGFGQGAPVITSFTAEAVASSDSGKVLVAGRSGNSAVIEVRNADGTLDTTFNKNGQVVSTTDTAYYAVVAQGDKIVVAGTMNGDLVIVRYLADGRIDPSFGTGGRMVVDFGFTNDTAFALAIAPDGKLVAAGQADGNFAVARFTADGRMDPTFAAGGMALLDLGSASDLAGAVAVQADGKIVIAGTSGTNVVVVRLQANGQDDSAALGSASPFSGDGFLQITGLMARDDASLADRSTALAIQSDGRILVGNHTASNDFGVVRITSAGNIDSSFGNDGLAIADFGGNDDADAILVQPTGEILVVGTTLNGSTGHITLAALSSSGELIEGFGEGGKLMLDSGMVSAGRELHVGDLVLRAFGTRQADGRVVVGTTNSAPQQQSQSVIRRLNVPGARSQSAGDSIATFGDVNGRNVKFVLEDDGDGTKIVFTVRGGTGALFRGADGKFNLVITDGGSGATVKIAGRGGDGRISFGDITSNGSIKSFTVKNGDVSGTFAIAGQAGKLTLGNVSGSICSAGSIQSVAVASLTNAKVLAGANLGANAEFGGTGASADSFGGAFIGTLKVAGQIIGSTIGAGLDPVDATFLDEDDRVIGGAASFIKAIKAKQADESSRFLAGSFGKVSLGAKVTPGTDGRFRVLA